MNRNQHARCTGSQRFASRRDFLWQLGGGLGGIALAGMLDRDGRLAASEPSSSESGSTAAVTPGPHFAHKAKRVIKLFMSCGVSQVDSFDYKPALAKYDGQPVGDLPGIEDLFFGKPGNWMKSPFRFDQYGECGKWCSEIFRHIAGHVDDLAFVHSMTTRSNSHGPAMFMLNTGFIRPGYPSAGSWITYGLGRESENLPDFVVLIDRGLPPGHNVNWSSGFLPAQHQGSMLRAHGDPILDLNPPANVSADHQRASYELLARLNEEHLKRNPADGELAARIGTYELAARMQLSVPEAIDLSRETHETRRLYGLDHPNPQVASFARNCLLARRLSERGVRMVCLYCGGPNMPTGKWNWDAHADLDENHRRNALISDQPIAALLSDLKQRGLWDETLITWTGEFGRTPMREGTTTGRDHNTKGFTMWMAGAGIRGGASFGRTDDFGYRAVEHPQSLHDFHATMLHVLGLDHERLTYYYNGRRQRLTDVAGDVMHKILA